jgi:AcrR family transcriptional regulator
MKKSGKNPGIQRRRPQQARALATIDAILKATARIVRLQGTQALTTNRIAEVAGPSIGTLYGYFPNKAAIILALARRILQEDEEALRAVLADQSAADPIRAVIRALRARHRTDRVLRNRVMTPHIGMGFGSEHSARVQSAVATINEHIFPDETRRPDSLRLFIITRAVLGVSRALIDGENPGVTDAVLEDELVRLVRIYLASP